MTKLLLKKLDRLVINGVEIRENVSAFQPPNKNGMWVFILNDGRKILATGNVLFIGSYMYNS